MDSWLYMGGIVLILIILIFMFPPLAALLIFLLIVWAGFKVLSFFLYADPSIDTMEFPIQQLNLAL